MGEQKPIIVMALWMRTRAAFGASTRAHGLTLGAMETTPIMSGGNRRQQARGGGGRTGDTRGRAALAGAYSTILAEFATVQSCMSNGGVIPAATSRIAFMPSLVTNTNPCAAA